MCLLRQTAIAANAPLLIPMVGTPRTHYSSPVYGDMHGFPPAILTTGTRDLLLSSTVRVHRKLRQAGVEATHAQFLFDPSAPETKEAFEEIAQFLTRIWANNGHVRSGTPLLGPSSGRRTPSDLPNRKSEGGAGEPQGESTGAGRYLGIGTNNSSLRGSHAHAYPNRLPQLRAYRRCQRSVPSARCDLLTMRPWRVHQERHAGEVAERYTRRRGGPARCLGAI